MDNIRCIEKKKITNKMYCKPEVFCCRKLSSGMTCEQYFPIASRNCPGLWCVLAYSEYRPLLPWDYGGPIGAVSLQRFFFLREQMGCCRYCFRNQLNLDLNSNNKRDQKRTIGRLLVSSDCYYQHKFDNLLPFHCQQQKQQQQQ